MIIRSRSIVLAAALLVAPTGFALAQQNNPLGNQGSNRSETASPGTADSHAASGANSADVASRATNGYSNSAGSVRQPGGTGHTVVPGDNSTVTGDTAASTQQKTGSTSSGSK